jgi:hypothetical protein
VCDYIIVIKVCQSQLHSLYDHLETTFIFYSFKEFKDLVAYTHAIGLQWISPMINMEESFMEHLAFSFYKHTFYVIFIRFNNCLPNQLKYLKAHIAWHCQICLHWYILLTKFITLLWILDMLQWFYDLYAMSLSIYLMMWFHFRYFLCDLSYDANAILT